MDKATLSRFPHLTWLRFQLTGSPGVPGLVLSMESVCHTVCCTFSGHQVIRQVTRGREVSWREAAGDVNVLPQDGERHTFVTAMSPDLDTVVFLIPTGHLRAFMEADEVPPAAYLRDKRTHDDPVLRACMARLARASPDADANGACQTDAAARRLLLRLVEFDGGGVPDWHDDASVFDPRTLSHLVEYIDEHLAIEPSLGDMALRTGLSPSHFAKKFRQSTGLSLHRFINRRRVSRSLDLLKTFPDSLAALAVDLGFSSQSHFTRDFHGLTGMTPAKYRSQFGRAIG